MVTSKDSLSHSFQDVMRTRLSFFFSFVSGSNPVSMSDSCGRFMATARDGIPYMPSLPLSFKLWKKQNDPEWMWRAGTLWKEAAPNRGALGAPVPARLGQRMADKGARICRSDGFQLEKKLSVGEWSATLTFCDSFFFPAFKFNFGDPDRCHRRCARRMGRREADSSGAMSTSHHSELCCLQDAASSGHRDGEASPKLSIRAPCSGDKQQKTTNAEAPATGAAVKKHQHKHNLKHRYEVMETLGKGTYGKVKKAVERTSLKTVSVSVCVCVCWCYTEQISCFLCCQAEMPVDWLIQHLNEGIKLQQWDSQRGEPGPTFC